MRSKINVQKHMIQVTHFTNVLVKGDTTGAHLKVSGPFVETSCVFQCIKNIINAEIWA